VAFSVDGVLRDRGGEIKIVGRSSSMSFLHENTPASGCVLVMLNVNVIKRIF